MDTMKDEQLAALDDEQRGMQSVHKEIDGYCDWCDFAWPCDTVRLLTALADARFELQEAKDSRDGFACDLDAAEAEVARANERADRYRAGRNHLQAEITRLTEQRDKLVEGNQRIVQRNLDLEAETFQQREDIRRLVEAAEGVRAMPGAGRELLLLLAEMEARYA